MQRKNQLKRKTPTTHLRISRPSQGDPGVCGGNVTIYLEPFMPQTTIFILGAGHIGKAVSELSSWLGYRVIVWDDREDIISTFTGEAKR